MDTLTALFTFQNIFTLFMLTLLQAVLGFDNLLYISIESKRVQADKQSLVRKIGLVIAILLRIILLWVIMTAIPYLQKPFFSIDLGNIVMGDFSIHSVIVIFGGGFIIYTAMHEIYHLLRIDNTEDTAKENKKSVTSAITMIVIMNLIFSFDSILSAIAITKIFALMAIAIIISGILMVLLIDHVAEFLKKNRLYEILGLFILFIVGIMLLSEGGHLAHLQIAGHLVEKMSMGTFYFVIFMLVVIDIIQSKYQAKLVKNR